MNDKDDEYYTPYTSTEAIAIITTDSIEIRYVFTIRCAIATR